MNDQIVLPELKNKFLQKNKNNIQFFSNISFHEDGNYDSLSVSSSG